ncbi:MAG: 23S rRNA pseudouridine(955/2504/2580) synthase, partial [Pseudomonadales bacterium]|nr:23S rRNA pseudouridine(955/2504/2580) synthase [Pseudomonadales bacterium]
MSIIHHPVRVVTVDEEQQGQRIDNFLAARLKGLPRTRLYRLLRKGEVRVNKRRVKPEYRVAAGDN